MSITLSVAQTIIATALAEARQRNAKPLAVVVLDADFVRARRKLAARETLTPSTTA